MSKKAISLKRQAASGVKWSTVSQISRQGTQLLTTIILARLLSPSDFGLVGMAMIVISFIGIFKDLGTSAAVIRYKELSEELLSSIFWVNVGFGALAMLLLFFGASLGGLFYHELRVVAILRVLSVTFLISGLSILQQALLERSLSFNKLAKVEITAVGCGAIVGIGLAVAGFGVWSLVFQSLTTVSVTTVLLWFMGTWRPKFTFHWKEVKSVSSYSLNLTGFNIFNYFARNADYLLIGRYLGAQDLGYYTLAYRILLFPLQNISSVIGRVMFPVYASVQDDNQRFGNAYLKVAKTIALVSFPLMMGVFSLAAPFVLTVFGAKWQPVILLIMILAPVGLIQSIGTTTGAIYSAKGRTDWMFRWGIGGGSFIVIAFGIGLHWGIIGVAVAYVLAVFSLSYFNFAIPFRLINLKFSRLLAVLWRPFVNSLIMFVVVLGFKAGLLSLLSTEAVSNVFGFTGVSSDLIVNAMVLGLSILVGVFVYALVTWFNSKEQLKELAELVGIKKRGRK